MILFSHKYHMTIKNNNYLQMICHFCLQSEYLCGLHMIHSAQILHCNPMQSAQILHCDLSGYADMTLESYAGSTGTTLWCYAGHRYYTDPTLWFYTVYTVTTLCFYVGHPGTKLWLIYKWIDISVFNQNIFVACIWFIL